MIIKRSKKESKKEQKLIEELIKYLDDEQLSEHDDEWLQEAMLKIVA